MKGLHTSAVAASVAAKRRMWHWCRRENGFSDLPIWRVVAEQLQLPVFQVVALVNRLEELANCTEPRGYVGEFNAAEFGAALGMPASDAARIYAALEDHAIGWVEQDYVSSFYARNPDREDGTAAERQRRRRERVKGMKGIARAFARGEIGAEERNRLERQLLGLMPSPQSTRTVTRDSVTVTPEESIESLTGSRIGEKSELPTKSSATEERSSEEDTAPDATPGLLFHVKRIVVERMTEPTTLAETRISRWLADLDGDAGALSEIILAADQENYVGARFHNLIVDQIRRRRHSAEPSLPLPPAALRRSQRG